MGRNLGLVLFVGWLAACGTSDDSIIQGAGGESSDCSFGQVRDCGPNDCGEQLCTSSGTWGDCSCESGSGGSAGSGGLSSGGASSGGASSGGTGAGPQGGTGAAPQGGSGAGGSGAGGTGGSGAGGSGGTAGAPQGGSGGSGVPGQNEVVCGVSLCERPLNQLCCVDDPLIGATTQTCQTSGNGCSETYVCDGAEDCPGECCATKDLLGSFSGMACKSSCSGSDVGFACTGSQNCATGLVCCGVREGFITKSYRSAACETGCGGENRILCRSNADCVNGGSCETTGDLPDGFKECR